MIRALLSILLAEALLGLQVKATQLFCRRGAQLSSHRGRSLVSRATDRVVVDTGDKTIPPWLFGFQCNERYLAWDESAHVQLLKIYAARELGKVGQQQGDVCTERLCTGILKAALYCTGFAGSRDSQQCKHRNSCSKP